MISIYNYSKVISYYHWRHGMWKLKSFEELSPKELEQIFRLRQSIFIVEQKSYFNDIDGNDYDAHHLFNITDGEIWAYCRIIEYKHKIIFGRVSVCKNKRGNGNGRLLLKKVLEIIYKDFESKNIHIMAMSYLTDFYESFGFKSVSDIYIIDQHPHIDMVLYRQ